jgi:NadR type nicotinamide-nucleotide adenylyltransferase
MLRRIAITGPESTGKSELCKKLASHFKTVWVPEFAREYIDGLGRQYTIDDIVLIAKGQLREEETAAAEAERFLFCDTELIVTKVWSEFKYGICDRWILENIRKHVYDLYLLCDIDIPWQEDRQREHPHKRRELFDIYFSELSTYHFPFRVISGLNHIRLYNAIAAIEDYFK